MVTMAAALLMTTAAIAMKINQFRRANQGGSSFRDTLSNPIYLLPFALLLGWSAALYAQLTLVWRLAD